MSDRSNNQAATTRSAGAEINSVRPDESLEAANPATLSERTDKRRLFIKTFGCQMNEYDSEKFEALLSSSHRRVDGVEDADLIIVNTCSVREKGEHKLFSLLGTLHQLKRSRPGIVVGVGGCVAQQEGKNILRRSPAVDFVVGTHNLSLVPSLVDAATRGAEPQVAIDYRDEWESLPEEFDAIERSEAASGPFPHMTPPIRALVAIQRGCSKNCSYCVVPTTRGKEVSRSPEEIEREVRLKIKLGAKEVLLLGQTVNSYGRDLSERFPFHRLIRRLAEIDGLKRIRFISPHPQEVRSEFLDLYSDVPQLCPHIHLPLQSGSDRILKLMNRNYRIDRYLKIVDSLRERCPNLAVTTDIIVGFPTETDNDFEQTLEVMRRVRFDSSYSFKYSRRPNTTAQADFSPEQHVSEDVVDRRLQAQQRLQDQLSMEQNTARIGKDFEVLVEGASTNISSCLRGRIPQNTWLEIEAAHEIKVGDLVQVRVDHASAWGLRGKAI
jgi:tRNA-2-methylthio-N6-dimethylallyladenosine synthase